MEGWVKRDDGQPKTWNKLIEALSNIEDLRSEVREIKQNLMSHGVELSGTYIYNYICLSCMP